jgi:hypothetical protein
MTISGSQLSSTLILDPTRTYWPKLGSLFALYNFVFHIEISQTVAPLTMLFGKPMLLVTPPLGALAL